MAAIFGKRKIFWKLPRVHFLDTLWVENFTEITLFCTVKANLCFSILGKNLKIQNGRHMWGGENFLKIAKSTFLRYPVGRKFWRNRSRCMVKEIEAILCFAILGKNSKIQNGRHMWEEEIFWKLQRVHCSDTLWVENFDEIPLSHTVKEIEFCVLPFLGKIPKFKMAAIFGEGKIFWKAIKSTLVRYPVAW